MREVLTKVYKFQELSKSAKYKALDIGRSMVDDNFSDFGNRDLTDEFCRMLREKGLPEGCNRRDGSGVVEWSLSNCQGDGVAFYGPIDHKKFIATGFAGTDTEYLNKFFNLCETHDIQITFNINRNRFGDHYSHARTMYVDAEYFFGDDASEEAFCRDIGGDCTFSSHVGRVAEIFIEEVRDVSHELEKFGYDRIEAEYDDDTIIDMFEVNEIEFTEDGKVFSE